MNSIEARKTIRRYLYEKYGITTAVIENNIYCYTSTWDGLYKPQGYNYTAMYLPFVYNGVCIFIPSRDGYW